MTDPETREPGPGAPQARQRRTRWPGWVWLIPLVALGFAAWLAVEEWVVGPRPLTVHFSSVEGIKPGAPVRYRGVQVGSVDRIRLNEDLSGATLVLDMKALKGQLGPETQVWIERPSLAPGQIGSLISGPYLAIAPAPGADVDELRGLEEAPLLVPEEPGRVFVLADADGEGLEAGAPLRFRGLDAGRVLGKRLGERSEVEISVFVEERFAEMVREATIFWRAGGLRVGMEGGLDVDFPSLAALATGAVAFDTPGVLDGEPAEAGARFPLFASRDVAETAATGPRLPYLVVFDEPVGDLAPGVPVTLAGKEIGRVAGTTLEVAPDGSGLITPATIIIDARQMAMDDLGELGSREALRERLDAIIGRLVDAGMRARVAEGGIVFGARSIELVIDPAAPPAAFSPEEPVPVIPAASGRQKQSSASSDTGAASGGAEEGAAAASPAEQGDEGAKDEAEAAEDAPGTVGDGNGAAAETSADDAISAPGDGSTDGTGESTAPAISEDAGVEDDETGAARGAGSGPDG